MVIQQIAGLLMTNKYISPIETPSYLFSSKQCVRHLRSPSVPTQFITTMLNVVAPCRAGELDCLRVPKVSPGPCPCAHLNGQGRWSTKSKTTIFIDVDICNYDFVTSMSHRLCFSFSKIISSAIVLWFCY
jgi:hypothetical protein